MPSTLSQREVGVFFVAGGAEGFVDGGVEDAAHEAGFAGTADAGEDGEAGEGNLDVDVFEIVGAGSRDGQVTGEWDVES